MTNYPTPTTDATMKEKVEVLKNDRRVASTYLDHTHSEEGGRFAKPTNVIGATPTRQYPAGPNWSVDPTGIEPPLGHAIDAHEPVGEYGEVQASIEELDDTTNTVADVASPCGEVVVSSSPVGDATTVFDVQCVASSGPGQTVAASVDDPSRTGGAEAPTVSASPDGEPPANPKPQPTRRV